MIIDPIKLYDIGSFKNVHRYFINNSYVVVELPGSSYSMFFNSNVQLYL